VVARTVAIVGAVRIRIRSRATSPRYARAVTEPPPGVAPPRRQHPRQNLILVVAGVLVAVTVVLVLVVTLGGSDGPAAGSPDAVTDDFAAAVRAHDSARIGALSCPAQRALVARPLRGLLKDLASAQRKGSAAVQGEAGVALIAVQTSTKSSGSMTIALRRTETSWCVASLAISIPVHA
jgi:hypothetical protein